MVVESNNITEWICLNIRIITFLIVYSFMIKFSVPADLFRIMNRNWAKL